MCAHVCVCNTYTYECVCLCIHVCLWVHVYTWVAYLVKEHVGSLAGLSVTCVSRQS